MRKVPFYPLLITMLISFGSYLGCDPNQVEQGIHSVEQAVRDGQIPQGLPVSIPSSRPGTFPASASTTTPPMVNMGSTTIPQRTGGTILIGSFNMQHLSPNKLAKPAVAQYLATIIRCFDVVAIQEISSKDDNTVPMLLSLVNRDGSRYSYTISPRIGNPGNSYAEQYAFIYDTNRIYTEQQQCFVVDDPQNLMHREPFFGRFQTRNSSGPPFTFTLINVHTDPDLIKTELNVLASVYQSVAMYVQPEDDVILLGDLNADPSRFQQLGQIRDVVPLIRNMPTNTVGTKINDNILINSVTTSEFTGRAGTIDYRTTFNLSQQDALSISDHLPVWAEFRIGETNGYPVAAQPISSLFR